MLDIVKDMVGGFTGRIISVLLKIIPDLNEIQTQAGNMNSGEAVNYHEIFKGLLMIYILTIFFFVFKKKEA